MSYDMDGYRTYRELPRKVKTMQVKSVGSNKIQVDKHNGTFLVSYETPVAALIPGVGWVRTEKFWSNTTSKHINHWLYVANGAKDVSIVPQEEIEAHFNG